MEILIPFKRRSLQAVEGMSLRLFSLKTRLWSIYWASSEIVELDVPQVGSFENKIGNF